MVITYIAMRWVYLHLVILISSYFKPHRHGWRRGRDCLNAVFLGRTDRDYEYEEVCTTAHSIFMIDRDAVHWNRH